MEGSGVGIEDGAPIIPQVIMNDCSQDNEEINGQLPEDPLEFMVDPNAASSTTLGKHSDNRKNLKIVTETQSLSSQNSKTKRKVARFSTESDVILLKRILEHNPYDTSNSGSSWKDLAPLVSADCNKRFTPRALKERSEFILEKYQTQKLDELKKTGTEQQLIEREMLLPKVWRLRKEFQVPLKSDRLTKREIEKVRSIRLRLLAAKNGSELRREDVSSTVVAEVKQQDEPLVDLLPGVFKYVDSDDVEPRPPSPPSQRDPLKNDTVVESPSSFTRIAAFAVPVSFSTLPSQSVPPSTPKTSVSVPGSSNSHLKSDVPQPKKMMLNIEHLRKTKAREQDIEWKRLEIEQLKAENESRRISLEEAKFKAFYKAQEAKDAKILELLSSLIERTKNA